MITADYPLSSLASTGREVREDVRRLGEALRTPAVQRLITDRTLRRPVVPSVPPAAGLDTARRRELPFPGSRSVADGLLDSYENKLRRPSRTVYVLDTSLADVELPPAAAGRLTELAELLDGLLDPGWVAEVLARDPQGVHAVSRAVRLDIPEAVDAYVRARWWVRPAPGAESPERHFERQLGLLHDELTSLAAALRETEARRQESHTRYLEDRA